MLRIHGAVFAAFRLQKPESATETSKIFLTKISENSIASAGGRINPFLLASKGLFVAKTTYVCYHIHM